MSNEYKTSDQNIAALLFMHGCEVKNTDRDNPRMVVFTFSSEDKDPQEIASSFESGKSTSIVLAQFCNAQRHIKALIHNNLPRYQ